MDNILGNANDVLNSMYSQREQLKGIKGKMMNIANQLGMSQTVMRLINKRSDQVYAFYKKYILNFTRSYPTDRFEVVDSETYPWRLAIIIKDVVFNDFFSGQTYTLGWNVSNNLHSLHNLEILRLKTSLISVQ